jgi:hypothetical protein
MQIDQNTAVDEKRPLFYVVDWLPPDFGAVGQYALIAAKELAAKGRDVYLIGLSSDTASLGPVKIGPPADASKNGVLIVHKIHAKQYNKANFARRLLWTISTNIRLVNVVFRYPNSFGAEVLFTGAPPFLLYFVITLKLFRKVRLTYRITDFYPEVIIAHLGRRPPLLALLERITRLSRKAVARFEVLGEDQRKILLQGGIPTERIEIKRYSAPISMTGNEVPAPKPLQLAGHKVLLYSGNYGIAHEVETVVQGFALHRRGNGRFGLWLNATGQSADQIERRLIDLRVPMARTPPVVLEDLAAMLAAADAHLITLRSKFAGIVFPSKVYACILSGRPIIFVGPKESDVHLLCTRARQRYIHIAPGDAEGFAKALDELSAGSP